MRNIALFVIIPLAAFFEAAYPLAICQVPTILNGAKS